MENKHIQKIAGLFNYPAAKEPMKKMQPGDAFHFEAEPTNPYDKNAVSLLVMHTDENGSTAPVRCGYVPKAFLTQICENGLAIAQIVRSDGAFNEIVVYLDEVQKINVQLTINGANENE